MATTMERTGARPADPPTDTIFTRWNAAAACVLLLAGLLYAPAMNGLAISDDHVLIGGSAIGGGHSLVACFTRPFLFHYFRPLVSVTFFVERRLWGELPLFFHQTNILLHVLTTAALIGLLRASFRDQRVALAGGALFAVQPAQVGAVAWIGGRTDALAALFLALFAWRAVLAARAVGRRRAAEVAWASAAFAAGILSKEQMLPALLLAPIAFRCFAEGTPGERWRQGARAALPLVALAAAFVAAWIAVYPEMLKPWPRGLAGQADLAGRTTAYYALLLFAPTRQWMNTFTLAAMEPAAWAWRALGLAAAAALALVVVRSVRRCPEVTWSVALLALPLLPVCNLVPLPSMVAAPWRAGMAGLGAAALLAYGGAQLGRGPWRWVVVAAYGVWLVSLSAWGVRQWRDDRQAYGTFLAYDPDALQFSKNLAATEFAHNRYAGACTAIERALDRLYAGDHWTRPGASVDLYRQGSAIRDRIGAHLGFRLQPDAVLADLFVQLGMARRRLGGTSEAQQAFTTAAALDPGSDGANLGLGVLEYDAGRYLEALPYLQRAASSGASDAVNHQALGQDLAALGRHVEAAAEFGAVVRLSPWYGPAYVARAASQLASGDGAGALATCRAYRAKGIMRTSEDDRAMAEVERSAGGK